MVAFAVAYAVVFQPNETQQNIMASKSRLAKPKLSIPSLELVATHIAAILIDNIKTALANMNIRNAFGWTDSTVVLHWLEKNGNYNQFVNNRVDKINEKDYITWRDVPTNEKPADIGSRSVYGNQLSSLWWNGPTWLQNRDQWPLKPIIKANEETEKEAKKIKTVLAANIKLFEAEKFDTLLEKYNLWKFLRIASWVSRFIKNVRRTKVKGPLTAEELINQQKFWTKREQQHYKNDGKFKSYREYLNLKENTEGIYEWQGRLQGNYPVYLSSKSLLSEKLIVHAYLKTIHGRVNITMTNIREITGYQD